MYNLTEEDDKFCKEYKLNEKDKYEKPSVTVDILIFTVKNGKLNLMLIKRGGRPFKNQWAIPGGFLDVTKKETIEQTAKRELKEETNIEGFLEKFDVFSEPERDPRMRVLSIAFIALLPYETLLANMKAGDDAKEVELFELGDKLVPLLDRRNSEIDYSDLAFDHEQIIKRGLAYLKKSLKYDNALIFFNLLNKDGFTISDLLKVHEAIRGEVIPPANFRRDFKNKYIKTGLAEETGELLQQYQRPAKLYRMRG